MAERRADGPPEPWPGDFASVEGQHLDAWMAATPSQKLAWLEQAIELAWKSGALPRRDEESS